MEIPSENKAANKKLQTRIDSDETINSINDQIRSILMRSDFLKDNQTRTGIGFTDSEVAELIKLKADKKKLEDEHRKRSEEVKKDFELENQRITS